jgi:HSP20 family molecular chaperone IbpA
MALFSPFGPWMRNESSLLDTLDDHPFLNMNSSFFRDANVGRNNRANVSETANEYKIEIDVPGYQKPEISIEFGPDGRSLTVSGKTEKSYEEGPSRGKGVTVEEVPEEGESPDKQSSKQTQSTAVAETNKEKTVGAPAGPKYWISERSVGSFTRTFNFGSPLDHDKASAQLENGVLTVVVPKTTKASVKKISIA